MKKPSILFLLTILIISQFDCNKTVEFPFEEPHVKNIILLIGDGMGLAAVSAAMTVTTTPLNIERCNISGFQNTYSFGNKITDSGAASTAIATGKKTYNGAIGVDSNGKSVTTILEIAEKNGLATGLITTSSITHATPAAFIAHESDRNSYEAIALDFLKTDIDLFIGGGYDHFAKRKDNLNLIDSLRFNGYEVDTLLSQILSSSAKKLAGLTAGLYPPRRLGGRGNMLPASSKKAIEILNQNPDGFFLMIEGAQIDWAAGDNSTESLIDETLDFDEAVGVALDFAQSDGRTLVIVTADHESGGVSILDADTLSHTVRLNFATKDHTGVMVPVYAYGPEAENFEGIYDNTDIFTKMVNALEIFYSRRN